MHRETVDLLLSAISASKTEDGLAASFFFGRPGARHWERNRGVEIYYRRRELVSAALHVRRHGPSHLRYLSVSTIWSMLQEFVSENFWYLADDFIQVTEGGTLDRSVSAKAREQFADAFAASPILAPRDQLTLFPLSTISVNADFNSESFFLVAGASLSTKDLPPLNADWFEPEQFPPLSDWKGRKWSPSAWLGIRSPFEEASVKMRAAILGAVALTQLPQYRYMFSDRTVMGGKSTISLDRIVNSFGDVHTPPIMHDIAVGAADHQWLSILSAKLVASERNVRRQIGALEYFYRAWALAPSERFPILCMAIDAVFGSTSHATQAVIDGIRSTVGNHVSEPRLRLLMKLRASVIHGGAPDVYDSRKYADYYNDFGADPIQDMDVVVAESLRKSVFGTALSEHADHSARYIAEAQAAGRLSEHYKRPSTILDVGDSEGSP